MLTRTRIATLALGVVAATLPTLPLSASVYHWDPTAAGNGTTGGATTSEATEWKTSGGNIWWDGANNVAWTDGNDATFAGTAGTIKLGTNVSAGTLNFNTAGYVIDLRDFTADAPRTLTLTGLSGEAATFRATQTPTNGAATLNLTMGADTVWAGNIGSGGDRIAVNVSGGHSLTVNQVIRNGGAFQQTLSITGTGTKLVLSGTGSTYGGNRLNVGAGATFDLGGNGDFSARQLTLAASGTITATGTAKIIDNNGFDASTLAGFLTGTLGVTQSDGTNAMTISNNGNTYSGGTTITTGSLNAQANNALGTGAVSITNSSGTSTLNFTSAAPVIGSLASSGAGIKQVVLGNTGVNTTLTIGALNTSTTYSGSISEFAGQTGALTKTGSGTLTLGGAASYTGQTKVTGGTLQLNATGSIASTILNVQAGTFDAIAAVSLPTFTSISGAGAISPGSQVVTLAATSTLAPGNSAGTLSVNGALALAAGTAVDFELNGGNTAVGAGVNDLVTGVVDLTLDGTLNVTPLASFAAASNGDTWRLFDYTGALTDNGLALGSMPTLGAGLSFAIDTATSGQVNLTIVPEPASLALLAVGGLMMLPRRRKAIGVAV